MTTRAQIVAEARTRLGERWQHQARLPGVATDCIGLVAGSAKAVGIEGAKAWFDDDEMKRYSRHPAPDKLLAAARRYMDEIKVREASEGDVLVLVHFKHPTLQAHFAIVTATLPRIVIIHAEAIHREVIENSLGNPWRATHAFRFRGLDGR